MKYYQLKWSSNLKEVGAYPQCESVRFIGDIQKKIPIEGKIEFDFALPEPEFEMKAKKNSFIRVVAIPSRFLVMDDELLNFIKKYSIGNHQNWKIKVWKNNVLIDNYNIFTINDTKLSRYVDFKSSEFYVGMFKDFTFKGENIPINNYDEYLFERSILQKANLWLRYNKVVLDLRQAKEDMFWLQAPISGYYFVSEKLKDAIEKNNFTGIKFKEIERLKKIVVKQ